MYSIDNYLGQSAGEMEGNRYICTVGSAQNGISCTIHSAYQSKMTENAFVVRDDIEYASGDILPLWGFGLLY